MLLPALAFAVALQATPEIGLKGHLNGVRVADRAQPVGELTVTPRKVRVVEAAPRTAHPRRTFKPQPRLGFVRNPQMADCRTDGLELAGNPEMLKAQPLSKLPKAHGERAVVRLVDGCPVAVMIAQGPVTR